MENKTRTIVITGASSGVGRAIALEFAQQKERLVLASRNIEALEELAKDCWQLGAEVKSVQTDTSDYRSVLNLAAIADEFGGSIEVWINNAGVLAVGEFDTTPMEVSTQVVKTNLLGFMNGAHAVLPYFKRQEYGILINNISIGGFLPLRFGAAYSASKFGLRGFTAALKSELSVYRNIHVCDLFPAFLDTPGIQHAANYTGKQIKPAPPVYDPVRVAQAVVKVSRKPSPSTMVGSLAIMLKISHGLFPSFTIAVAGAVVKRYLKQAAPIASTSGNIFNPVSYGNAIHGGWGIPGKPKAHRKYVAGGLLAVATLGLLWIRKKR